VFLCSHRRHRHSPLFTLRTRLPKRLPKISKAPPEPLSLSQPALSRHQPPLFPSPARSPPSPISSPAAPSLASPSPPANTISRQINPPPVNPSHSLALKLARFLDMRAAASGFLAHEKRKCRRSHAFKTIMSCLLSGLYRCVYRCEPDRHDKLFLVTTSFFSSRLMFSNTLEPYFHD